MYREDVGHDPPEGLEDQGDVQEDGEELHGGRLYALHVLPVVVGRHPEEGTREPLAQPVHQHHPGHERRAQLTAQHPHPPHRLQHRLRPSPSTAARLPQRRLAAGEAIRLHGPAFFPHWILDPWRKSSTKDCGLETEWGRHAQPWK